MNLHLILLVFAFVCAVLAAFNIGAPRWNLIAAALAFYFAALIFGGIAGRHASAFNSNEQKTARVSYFQWPEGLELRK